MRKVFVTLLIAVMILSMLSAWVFAGYYGWQSATAISLGVFVVSFASFFYVMEH